MATSSVIGQGYTMNEAHTLGVGLGIHSPRLILKVNFFGLQEPPVSPRDLLAVSFGQLQRENACGRQSRERLMPPSKGLTTTCTGARAASFLTYLQCCRQRPVMSSVSWLSKWPSGLSAM